MQVQSQTFAARALENWLDNAHVATAGFDTAKVADSSLFIPVTCPGNGEIIAYCPKSSQTDVDKAVASSQRAFESWRQVKDNMH